uniref:Uncharacterized protein n=1 Tax=viral metagenome TaxID=1070528 RepID=A0A6H1ZH79_9ZZZZ
MGFSDKIYKADIDFATSGDQEIIAAPSAGRIVIDFILVFPEGATTLQLLDGSTDYGGQYALDAKQPFVLENTTRDYEGLISCTNEAAFQINSTAAVQVSGFVKYRILDTF